MSSGCFVAWFLLSTVTGGLVGFLLGKWLDRAARRHEDDLLRAYGVDPGAGRPRRGTEPGS